VVVVDGDTSQGKGKAVHVDAAPSLPDNPQGRAEVKWLAFADEQNKESPGAWDAYVVRPGGVLYKSCSWMTFILGNGLFIGNEVLAAAIIATVLEGGPKKRLFHAALVEKGKSKLGRVK
jgi:hypothetical protein